MKYGGGSIMVWGCMSWVGVGNLYRINGIMNSQVYLDILWNEIDRCLRLYGALPTSKNDLWKKIQVVWQSIEVEYIQKLIRSMLARVVDLLAAKGGYTRW